VRAGPTGPALDGGGRMNDHRIDMTRLVLVLVSLVMAAGCGSDKKGANPLEAAKAAKAAVCACPTTACREQAQVTFDEALKKVTDPAQNRALSGELAACLAKPAPQAWQEILDEVCACTTLDCVTVVQEKATRLATMSDRDTVVAKSAEIERCLVDNDPGLKALTALQKQACACTDKACAEKARADLKATSKLPSKFVERAMQIGVEIVECIQKFE
jgi:hypothetical protein